MAGGRPKVALILTDDERVQLDSLAHHSRTAPRTSHVKHGSSSCAHKAIVGLKDDVAPTRCLRRQTRYRSASQKCAA